MKLFRICVITSILALSSSLSFSEPLDELIHNSSVKCLTPLMAENQGFFAAKTATRSEREKSAVSEEGHFRVHYDTSGWYAPEQTDSNKNGIPDYVDSMLEYLEYAWDKQINVLGYNEPPSDNGLGGGDEVDCYITNFGIQPTYGGTFNDSFVIKGSTSSHIVIDNGFTETQYGTNGLEALRVTTAHEFFHVVQFGYLYSNALMWWIEQTAVWMEEYTWPEIDDYIQYVRDFMLSENTSLPELNGLYKYGAGIWPIFLTRQFGDDIVKSGWERYSQGDNLSISALDDVLPGGLADAYSNFAVWNFFTKERANTYDFYPDGDKFPATVPISWQAMSKPAAGTFTMNFMTTKYIELIFAGTFGMGDGLEIAVNPGAAAQFRSALILYNDPEDYEIHNLESNRGTVPFFRQWQNAVLAVSCTNSYGSGLAFSYDVDDWKVAVDSGLPLAFSVNGSYPNPFNPATTIAFTLPENGQVTVRAYNISGQLIDTLLDRELGAGEKRIVWKPDNLSGGLYFIHISTAAGTKTVKTLYLK